MTTFIANGSPDWIWLTGRMKDEINRARSKIQPAEIDLSPERHPAVLEAGTFAISDPTSGEAVAAAVRFMTGTDTSTECLHELRFQSPSGRSRC